MIASDSIDFHDIQLDSKKPERLFSQLARELKRLILTGGNHAGMPMPSARKLADLLDINRMTALKAYGTLLTDRIIEHASPRCYRVSETLRRRALTPFSTVGVILPCSFSYITTAASPVALQYISGVIDAAAEKHLSTIMLTLPDANATPKEIDEYLRELSTRLLGIVHIGDRDLESDPPLDALMQFRGLPQVFIAAIPKLKNIGSVLCDTSVGARALAELLIPLGHRHIGLIGYPIASCRKFFDYASGNRLSEIRAILTDYGLACQEQYSLNCELNPASISDGLEAMLKKNQLPTLFICQNDEIAHWTISALRSFGLSVPNDISVVGYDGYDSAASAELTTICQPFHAIGKQAVLSLMDYSQRGIGTQNRTKYLQPYLLSRLTLAQARRNA